MTDVALKEYLESQISWLRDHVEWRFTEGQRALEVATRKLENDFAKDNDKFRIKGGVSDGKVLDDKAVVTLASMPGPRELKAQFLALLNTPATQMVRVLQAPVQSFLNVLNAKKDAAAA